MCPRCGGRLYADTPVLRRYRDEPDEITCLSCGWVDYGLTQEQILAQAAMENRAKRNNRDHRRPTRERMENAMQVNRLVD